MKRFCVFPVIAAVALLSAWAQHPDNPFAGRWDMTLTIGNGHYPSWLEVTGKGGNLEARVQQSTGNVAPVAAVRVEGARLIVTVSAAAPPRPASDNRPAFAGRPERRRVAHGGRHDEHDHRNVYLRRRQAGRHQRQHRL